MSNPRSQGGVWSQFDQDPLTLSLVAKYDPPKTFVEIGAGHDGENNTHILLDHGWTGLWVEGNPAHFDSLRALTRPGLTIKQSFVTTENVWDFMGDVPLRFGLLSIDVDGNDYWIWKELGCMFKPAIVIIESQLHQADDYIMSYDPEYVWDHKSQTCGAGAGALKALGAELGYEYVGRPTNPHCADLFFVRRDLM